MGHVIEEQQYQKAYEFLKAALEAEILRVRGLWWRGRSKADAMRQALHGLLVECDGKSAQARFEFFSQQLTSNTSSLYQSLNQHRLPLANAQPTKVLNQMGIALWQANRTAYFVRGQWGDAGPSPVVKGVARLDSPSMQAKPPVVKALTWSTLQDFLKKHDEKKSWWQWDSSFIKRLKQGVNHFIGQKNITKFTPSQELNAFNQLSYLKHCVVGLQEFPRHSRDYAFCAELLEYVLPGNAFLCVDLHDRLQLKEDRCHLTEKDIEARLQEQYPSQLGCPITKEALPAKVLSVVDNKAKLDPLYGKKSPPQWIKPKVSAWANSKSGYYADEPDPIMHEADSAVSSQYGTPNSVVIDYLGRSVGDYGEMSLPGSCEPKTMMPCAAWTKVSPTIGFDVSPRAASLSTNHVVPQIGS